MQGFIHEVLAPLPTSCAVDFFVEVYFLAFAVNHVLPAKWHMSHSMSQKNDDPSGFSSNLVRPMYIQSNLATPNFNHICYVFLELWSSKNLNFGEILTILAVL